MDQKASVGASPGPGPGVRLDSIGKIVIWRGDITTLDADAIVNAANSELLPGGGVCGAIHRAAGPELAAECRTLGGCATGDAKLTRGHGLPARFVLHAVGPIWRGGGSGEPAQLASCYRRCCEIAEAHGLRTLAFPAISTGVFGYPLEPAAAIAVRAVLESLERFPSLSRITLVCFDAATLAAYQSALSAARSARPSAQARSPRPDADRLRDRILGGLWGSVVGDALGVPVEFSQRHERDADPVREMRGFGTYLQPPGTWSDDTSLMLCTLYGLLGARLDLADIGARFVRYADQAYMTPHGAVFDIGGATLRSIARLRSGVDPIEAGGIEERDNGNGSLMRILPVALRFLDASDEELADIAHKVSALTHRHARTRLACGYFCLMVQELLAGSAPLAAYQRTNERALRIYARGEWQAELPHFRRVLDGALPGLRREQISGSGYVVHTLEAAIWCLLKHGSYSEVIFAAINLGDDTDTTACVAGGLAGVHYGLAAIPPEWRTAMARHDDLGDWFERFAERAISPATATPQDR